VLDFVAFHADLVRSDNGLEAVVLAESLGDIWSELQANAALAGSSSGRGLRVCPEHLHHEAGLAGLSLLEAVQLPYVVECDLVV
jgi:hypothetical protein